MDEKVGTSWGKTTGSGFYPLVAHHLDTALVMQWLFRSWLRPGLRDLLVEALESPNGDGPGAERLLMFLGASHDVGKANPAFQTQVTGRMTTEWRQGVAERLASAGLPDVDAGVAVALRSGAAKMAKRHEYVGFHALSRAFGGCSPADAVVVDEWLAVVAGGHHGRWESEDASADSIVAGWLAGPWGSEVEAQRRVVEEGLGVNRQVPALLGARPAYVVVLLSGLLILADWLASEDSFVEGGIGFIEGGLDPAVSPDQWLAARDEQARQHVLSLVPAPTAVDNPTATVLGDFSPRHLQSEAMDMVGSAGGLWTVMYPTGEGKTEAALLRHLADSREGLIFALPTRATTDAMDARLERVFVPTGNTVYLSHQYAVARRFEKQRKHTHNTGVACCNTLEQSPWFTTSIRRLVAPYVAATCDQVLAGALTQWHITLRLLALANHHVVFDEVHTMDAYQQSLLEELLSWFGATNTRVTLLSATLPAATVMAYRKAYAAGAGMKKADVPDYDVQYPGYNVFDPRNGVDVSEAAHDTSVALTQPTPPVNFAMTWVEERNDMPALLSEWAVSTSRAHPQSPIAVVANTVSITMETAAGVAGSLTGDSEHEVLCLNSQMTMKHRSEVESHLLSRLGRNAAPNKPLIVVGTQIIEASLDIDFDFMASMLSPASSLIQRAGRLWRFGDSPERTLRTASNTRTVDLFGVGTPAGASEAGSLPYFSSELDRVANYLTDEPCLIVPSGVQEFVETARPSTIAEFTTATSEFAAESVRLQGAQDSKAPLKKYVMKSPRAIKWGSLVQLTLRHDPDEVMATRYIDRPTYTFMLFDGHQRSEYTAGTFTSAHADATFVEAITLLQYSVPVGGQLGHRLYKAHLATLAAVGLNEWKPESRMLLGALPLDLAQADMDVCYDELLGLVPRKAH